MTDHHSQNPRAALEEAGFEALQRLYAEACTWSSDGQRRVDQERLIQSLVRAGVDPLTQQELYSFALQADADGHTGMLSERMLAALERASQRAALASS